MISAEDKAIEARIQDIVERIEEQSKDELIKEMGSTSLAFFDFQNMSKMTQIAYIATIMALFAIIFTVIFRAASSKEPDFNQQRKEKLAARKNSKGKKNQ